MPMRSWDVREPLVAVLVGTAVQPPVLPVLAGEGLQPVQGTDERLVLLAALWKRRLFAQQLNSQLRQVLPRRALPAGCRWSICGTCRGDEHVRLPAADRSHAGRVPVPPDHQSAPNTSDRSCSS